jgi:hypothetical protein
MRKHIITEKRGKSITVGAHPEKQISSSSIPVAASWSIGHP